ncbi:MAG: hypothetical protein JW832_06890 [Deltaproteobacteria bacterium]|nr:hypothetical protein [Deltaproteobacteria bacterium]
MKCTTFFRTIALAGVLLFVLCPDSSAARAAGGSSPAYNFLILEPGHSQTLYFELSEPLSSSSAEFYACYVLTIGAGTLNVRIGTASSVGQDGTVIYAVAGLVNTTPVFKYAYNAETISYNAEVPAVGIGIFFAGIVRDTGSPDYPIVMSLVVSLIQ